MAYKAIIWGCGREYSTFFESIHKEVFAGRLEIIGITSANTIYKSIDGYPFIEKEDLKNIDYDFIIVAVKNDLPDIYHEGELLGINRSKFIRADVFSIINFNIDKYMKLRENPVSIISISCFGGFLYHRLDLPFASPTINLCFTQSDFIKFSISLPKYIDKDLEFDYKNYEYESSQKFKYPVMKLDDIYVHFSHYPSVPDAIDKWKKRSEKIDYNNILVVMWSDNEQDLQNFENIPYRKVCFTSFKSDIIDTIYLPKEDNREIWSMFHGAAQGLFQIFDPIKFMLGEPDFLRCEFK